MTTLLTHCCVKLLCVFQLELLSYKMGRDEAYHMCISKIKNGDKCHFSRRVR